MPKKVLRTRICPKCKSADVSKDLSMQAYGQGSFFNQYECKSCGYTGQFFPEVDVSKPKKKSKKKKIPKKK